MKYQFKKSLIATSCLLPIFLTACQQTTRSTASQPSGASEAEQTIDVTGITTSVSPLEIEIEDTADRALSTVQQAKEFLEAAELEIKARNEYASRIAWVNANFITHDTDWLAARSSAEYSKMLTRLASETKRFVDIKLPSDMARKMDILKRGSNFPAPEGDKFAEELAQIETRLNSSYAKGTFAYRSDNDIFSHLYEELEKGEVPDLSLEDLSEIMAKSRDPEELLTVWTGWREVSPSMQDDYARMAEIINAGSRELGFADTGALWRAGYDMPADEFTAEADRLWGQVKPLYDELHCYVRAKLNAQYGDEVVPLDQAIRADLLGNMWGQSWGNIYDLVKPDVPPSNIDLTQLLLDNDYDALKMVKTGEDFFSSLGFAPLPDTFWDRSLITRPEDRQVVCHASAWNLDDQDDVRIKMCTRVTGEDFQTVHHELGHNYYQRAYKAQPVYYQNGANDGFHEAIGDLIALSITPDYLQHLGLISEDDIPDAESDIDLLMRQALEKIAFLPFGLLVDKWRWQVFSGELTPETYNQGWWDLRSQYQGLRPPAERPDTAFDPGAKYHIPGNTPYMRYFLAHILQFQFHKAACEMAAYEGPLHRCSIYGQTEVGKKLDDMLAMGASRPWPDALEAFTGTRRMDGSAILSYFEPLMDYLKEHNEEQICGWE